MKEAESLAEVMAVGLGEAMVEGWVVAGMVVAMVSN